MCRVEIKRKELRLCLIVTLYYIKYLLVCIIIKQTYIRVGLSFEWMVSRQVVNPIENLDCKSTTRPLMTREHQSFLQHSLPVSHCSQLSPCWQSPEDSGEKHLLVQKREQPTGRWIVTMYEDKREIIATYVSTCGLKRQSIKANQVQLKQPNHQGFIHEI